MMSNGNVIDQNSVSLIKQVLDPFHDTQLDRLSGWSDANTAPSIVRCVKQTQVISKPGTLAAGTWDLTISNWSWLNATAFCTQIFPRNNSVIGDQFTNASSFTTTGVVLGGVQAWAKLSTVGDLDVLAVPTVATLDLGSSFVQGACRLVGLGIEAVNVTPELYKGGQVGVWRLPEPAHMPDTFQYQTANAGSPAYMAGSMCPNGQIIRGPPKNFKQLMLVPGSRQWEAKDGAYIAIPFLSEENPAMLPSYLQPLVEFDNTIEDHITSSASGPYGQNTGLLGVPALTNLSGTGLWPDSTPVLSVPAMVHAPIHQGGMMFSGLSDQSTIALSVIYYVEEFPGFAQQDLLTLATPSLSYDPVAMNILTSAFKTLPVGVPAGMNGLGDWFAMAVQAASKVVAPIALAAGQPAIAALAGGAGMLANQYLTAQSSFSKPTVKQQAARPIQPTNQEFIRMLPSAPKNIPKKKPVSKKGKKSKANKNRIVSSKTTSDGSRVITFADGSKAVIG